MSRERLDLIRRAYRFFFSGISGAAIVGFCIYAVWTTATAKASFESRIAATATKLDASVEELKQADAQLHQSDVDAVAAYNKLSEKAEQIRADVAEIKGLLKARYPWNANTNQPQP